MRKKPVNALAGIAKKLAISGFRLKNRYMHERSRAAQDN
jgi:hypothetical protein